MPNLLKQSRRLRLLLIVSLLVVLGFSLIVYLVLREPANSLRHIFPALANLSDDATAFSLNNDWTGLAEFSTQNADYTFKRKNNNFAGQAIFKVSGNYRSGEATRNILIPGDAAKDFLQSLTKIPLEEGQYQPFREHTDDYPSITIQIVTKTGTLTVYTTSQNSDSNRATDTGNVPWAVSFAGREFVVNSDAPAQALDKITPYLQKEGINELERSILGTPTPIVTTKSGVITTPPVTTPSPNP